MKTIKSLPVADLELVAICFQCDETDEGRPVFDYEVLNQAGFERASIPSHTIACDCCGHSLKYACVVQHLPTQDLFYIGRDCARKIEYLRRFDAVIEGASIAVAERAACNAREHAALAQSSDDFKAAYHWAGTVAEAPELARDIRAKIRRYGSPSEAQKALLIKIWSEDLARRATATGSAPRGKHTVTGTIISIKMARNKTFDTWQAKTLIDLGNGVRVYGNAPSSVYELQAFGAVPALLVTKGQRIQFTATFEPSRNDKLFGFWKRPSRWNLI